MHSPSVSALEPVHSHTSLRSAGLSLSQLSHPSLKQMSAVSGSRASVRSTHSRTQPDSSAVGGPSAKTLYRERMELCLDWFSGWTDGQRKKFLSRLGVCLKPMELLQLASLVELKAPKEQLDFTQVLTREISLHILSYLDPRSLSRCAQVSWHWLWLSEQDVLWQPKCIERGWYLHYSPLPKQYGAWKQHYVACLLAPPSGVHLPPSSQHLRIKSSSPLLPTRTVPIIQPEDWEDTAKQQFQLSQSTDDPQLQTYTLDPSLPFYLPPQKTIKGDHKPWLDPDPNPEDLEKGWRSLCEGSLPMHRSVEFQKHSSLHPSTYSAVSRAYSKASAFQSPSKTYWRSQTPRRPMNKLTDSLKLEEQQDTDFLRPSTAPASLSDRDRMIDTFKHISVSALSVHDSPWYKTAGIPSEEGNPLFYAPPSLYHNSTLSPATRDLHYYAYPHTDYCSLARGLPTLYHPRLVLFPSTLLSWQLLAAAAQPDTLCLVFDPSDVTLSSLSRKIDSLLAGRIARSVALFSPLASDCFPLGSILSFGPKANLVDSESYESLWEGDNTAEESSNFISSLRKYILPTALGSRIDIFSPSPPPDKLHPRLQSLSALAKLLQVPVSCPSSVAALYSLRNEEWSWVSPSQNPEDMLVNSAPSHTPPSLYFLIPAFLSWCHLAESCTLAIHKLQLHLSGYLKQARHEIIGSLAGKIVHHALALSPGSEMVAMTNTLRPILLKHSNDVIRDQLDKNAFCDDVIGILRQGEEFEEQHPIFAPEVWPSHLLGPSAGSCSWFEGSRLTQRLCYPMLWGHNLTEWGTCSPPKDRRGLVLWEWYHTELTYSHMLQLVLHEYQHPLRDAVESNHSQPLGLTSHELDMLFADIQLLKDASTDQISKLDHILTSWESSIQPPASFLLSSLLSSLTAYKNYIFNYPALTRMLNQAVTTSGRLRVFLRRKGLQPYTSHCSLPVLLMAPLQRLRSIHQLLSALLSLTSDSHPDTKDGTVPLAKISSLLEQSDVLEKRIASERELSSLSKAITGCPVLAETGRELLRSWKVELMVNTSQNGEKRLEAMDSLKLYIFSDALLLSRMKEYYHGFTTQAIEEEEFIDSIGITRLSVCEISTDLESVGCELRGSKKVWKVAFHSEEERNSFLECFVSLNKSI